MSDDRSTIPAEGEQEALLYIVQIAVGIAAWLAVVSIVRDRPLGDLLGFVAMCAAQYPFARRTWAAGVSPRRYWAGVLIGAAAGAGLRMLLL